MLNNKGFTVIELIMSFAFVAILSASLFGIVVNYKDKERQTSLKADLLSFKSKLTIDIQQDIRTKILEYIDYCTQSTGERINKCVELHFKNGEIKKLRTDGIDKKTEYIDNGDGTKTEFEYEIPYISYGGIKYSIPNDGENIMLDTDYTLEYTTPADGLENNLSLYKIRIGIKHKDIDGDMDISIVASGNRNINSSGGVEYVEYEIGDRVQIQLGGLEQAWFRVIKNSGKFENKLTLLLETNLDYDNAANRLKVVDDRLVYSATAAGMPYSSAVLGNEYDTSLIKGVVEGLKRTYWTNPTTIRLITAEEIGYIVTACPKYQLEDAPDMNLTAAGVPEWITNTNYWTMSPKLFSGSDNGKKVWNVNANTKYLTSTNIESTNGIRPVIEITKGFVLIHEPA